MRVVFMGTPDFAVPSLVEIGTKGIEICLVVTQPDKPAGRGQKLQENPVKKQARKLGLRLRQPANVNTPEFLNELRDINPDAIIVVAFGQKIGPEILSLPKIGCLNVHASLLPKYRGASPIQRAIMSGDKHTGVTIMKMDEGWDTGDMLAQKEISIADDATGQSLHDQLAQVGAQLLTEVLLDMDNIQAIKQDNNQASVSPKIKKEDGLIDWSQSAYLIDCQIRALNPWPGTYTHHQDKMLKIQVGTVQQTTSQKQPGQIIDFCQEGFLVQCGQDALLISQVQPENKQKMNGRAYVNGYGLQLGAILGRK